MIPPILSAFGGGLSDIDHHGLSSRWITLEGANDAGLRRVDSYVGREMFGRKQGDLAGIIIPNVFPSEGWVREYRLRLDNPDLEYRGGKIRETKKYLQPSQRGNLLYIPPGVSPALLTDVTAAVIVTEGEFKGLALWRLANHETAAPRFLPVSVAGVWNWRGTVGKTTGPKGDR